MELLAPAGNEECFFAAIENGADAVYLGLSGFSARKNAGNFNKDNIAFYVNYAHNLGVKVYVALNTLVKDCETEAFLKEAEYALSAGADALIIQDIFLAPLLKSRFPSCVLHLSTQAGVNNIEGANLAAEYGFSRVILARETEQNEIKKIAEKIETEIFVHGALCSCFSGHCYMSSFIGGNSGNRGLCKQPCRKKYTLETKVGNGEYAISLSDLKLDDYIPKIKNLGVGSLKIEGRMRSPEYVAAAVRLYRAVIDGKNIDNSEIYRTYNRGNYTKGYAFGFDGDILSDKIQNHTGDFFGIVKSVGKDRLTIDNLNYAVGDCFKILRDGREAGNAIADDKRGLAYKGDVKEGDKAYITKDIRLINRLVNPPKKLRELSVEAYFTEGENPVLTSDGVTITGDETLETAKTVPLTEKEIKDNLSKTDKYPFSINANVIVRGRPFIIKSKLNKLRSSLYEKVFLKGVKPLKILDNKIEFSSFYDLGYKGVVMSDKALKNIDGYAFVYRPTDYDDVEKIGREMKNVTTDKFLFVPSFINEKDEIVLKNLLKYFDGVYADGLYGLSLAGKEGKKVMAGVGLNVFNSVDLYELNKRGVKEIVFSQELSSREIENIKGNGYAFTFGSIRVAEFLYCPFGKKCGDCKRGNRFKLTDEAGRTFELLRYKLGGRCRFELYNPSILKNEKSSANFYNFIGFSETEARDVLDGKEPPMDKTYTKGNYIRGVL